MASKVKELEAQLAALQGQQTELLTLLEQDPGPVTVTVSISRLTGATQITTNAERQPDLLMALEALTAAQNAMTARLGAVLRSTNDQVSGENNG